MRSTQFKEKISALKRKEFRQLIENFFSLSILNGFSFILPLLTLPYLLRIIGVEKFGAVSFALVIVQYINLFSTYGFSFSATKQISIYREDSGKVSEIFSSVIIIRSIIASFCTAILLCLIFIIPKLYDERVLYLFSLGIIIGDIFIPIWLFQGMEKMKYVSIVNIASKLVFTILIFVFINVERNYIFVPLLTSIGSIVASIISIFLSIRMFKLKFFIPSKVCLRKQFKEGWHLFISLIGINFYRNANPLILGVMTNDLYVGYYISAEKIIKAVQSMVSPFTESMYPFFSRKFAANSDINNINSLFKIAQYYVMVLLILTVLIFTLSKTLVLNYLGKDLIPSILNLQILSFVILFGGLNYFFGIIGLINMGYEKIFTRSIIISGLLSLAICISLSHLIFDKAASVAMLTGEISLFILLFSSILKVRKSSIK